MLEIIENNSRINSSMIAKKLSMRGSSVKYYVDKLANLSFNILEKDNREIKLYLSYEAIYE